MSTAQTQSLKKNRKAFSKTLKSQIKRKPHTEPINGVDYTYGLLQKKSQSSLFNNQRFLIVKGHDTFGYVSKLPDETLLPFLQQKNIPKCKVEIPLEKLEISNQKEILIVQFIQQGKKDKTRWQFTCGSKVKAIEWRQKLQGAKSQKISAFKNSAFKVILEDSKQNIDESQIERQNEKQNAIKRQKLENEQLSSKKQGEYKNQNIEFNRQQNKLLEQNEKNAFITEKKNNLEQKYRSQKMKKDEADEILISAGSQQKFPEVNIFESLLYSSAMKQPSRLLFENEEKRNEKSVSGVKSEQKMVVGSDKAEEQYERLKRQQVALEEQLREEKSGFLGSVLGTLTDKRYQVEKLKKEWGYEFAKGGKEYEIVESFKIYSEIIVSKIVDELALESKKRYYQPASTSSTSIRYEIDGVSFELYFHALKEFVSYEKRGSIISAYSSKFSQKQFNNYNYILSLTANKGRIRVPLSMIVQYKGFVCKAKVLIPEAQSYQNLQSLSKELALLQAQSKVSNSVFEHSEQARIVPLNSKAYQKIARLQNSFTPQVIAKKFDICYVQSLVHYLPQDFYFITKSQSSNNPNKNDQLSILSPVHTLRKQLIQDEEYDDMIFSGQNMVNVTQRLKIPPQMKQAIDVLIDVSNSINERVNAIVAALQGLDETITNSKQLSNLMHGYGVNMRYLGLVLQRSRESWLRMIIMSEIVARCGKKFLEFDLQECILNLNESKGKNVERYLGKIVISFMNRLLGSSEECDNFWIQLSRQSQQDYHCFVDKRELNVMYLIQAIQIQCKIELVNVVQRRESFFRVAEPLTLQNFIRFVVKSKVYDMSFTEMYSTVSQHLKQESQESFEQLSILLNIQRKSQLPSHFEMNKFNEKIELYLINWFPPKEGRHLYYRMDNKREDLPCKTVYEKRLGEIKWVLKEKGESEAQKVRDWMVQHIHEWLGEYHPLLSQLYDIFSRYYLSYKKQQKKAITYCKSSIKNLEKLLSRDNIKLADRYYMLGEIYINYEKKSEALGSLNRARQIMEKREDNQQNIEGYGMVMLRIAQVMLSLQLIGDAIQHGKKAYATLIQTDQTQKLLQSMELLARGYEISSQWKQYASLVQEFIDRYMEKLVLVSEDTELLQRVLKIIFMPYLHTLTDNNYIASQLVTVIDSFSSLASTTPSTYTHTYNYLKQLISSNNQQSPLYLNKQTAQQSQSKKILPSRSNKKLSSSSNEGQFPHSFIHMIENELQVILQEIESSGLMTRWKGFENYIANKQFNKLNNINPQLFHFLSLLETLTIFLGESWIQSVLIGS